MRPIQLFVLSLLTFFGQTCLHAQCNPDLNPPFPFCTSGLTAALDANGTLTIWASDIDEGSYDDCSAVSLYLEEGLPPSATPPATQSLDFDTSDVGLHNIVLWVVDQAGNHDYCLTTIEVTACQGTPTLACNDELNVTLDSSGTAAIEPGWILEGGPYCSTYGIDFFNGGGFPGLPVLNVDTTHIGSHTVVVYDTQTSNACWGTVIIQAFPASCTPDLTPPVPYCKAGLSATLDSSGQVTIWATDFDAGSFDNCSAIDFFIEEGLPPSATPPITVSLDFDTTDTGLHEMVVWVVDQAANHDYCTVSLEILGPDCDNDVTAPVCTAPADATISLASFNAIGIDPNSEADLAMYFGEADATDNCSVADIIKSIEVVNNGNCGLTAITRTFVAFDQAGNLSLPCQQVIDVFNEWTVALPGDHFPGQQTIDSLQILNEGGGLIGVSYEDVVYDFNCDGTDDKIVRKWTALNWCDAVDDIAITTLPALDLNNDGQTGDSYDIVMKSDSIFRLENGQPVQNLGPYENGISYTQVILFNHNDSVSLVVNGTVFHDGDGSCGIDSSETKLAGWPVMVTGLVTGHTQNTLTDSLGQYSFELCTTDTLAEISLNVPFNYGGSCGTTHTAQFTPGLSQTVQVDIPVHYDTLCPILWVDISTPFLRRCFTNYYTVSYCNYSADTIEDVYVEVQLDSFMDFTSSEITGTHLGGNLYTFDLGNVAAGECHSFKIFFDLNCDADLGITHCVDAHIFPDTLCPIPTNWSGANIEVEALCQNDSVFLSVLNTGSAAMAGPLEYIVVEDVIMLIDDEFNLGPGQIHHLDPIPANGATYRIEAPQEPGHPYPGVVARAIEGCNGINILGLVNLFPLENPSPFIAVDCQQNIGAFDPNDKQAFPTGYGEDHFIKRNTDIDYLIRFQNTGTDTAFTVVILDELDPALDPASIRPGAASHPYRFEMLDGNRLRFTFADIMLPDSNVNEAASHGFVKFKASQMSGLPLGTVIENEAAIYFDFNDPIITNTVYHTIGENFVEIFTDADERPTGLGSLLAYPNPSPGNITFELPTAVNLDAVFYLQDALGRTVRRAAFSANTFLFERQGLPPGVYFYRIEVENLGRYTGKIILK